MPFRPKTSRFWHYDFQIRGRRFHGSCGTEDFEEAKAVEAEQRFHAKRSPQAQGAFTLSEAIGTYWSDVSQHQSSAGTTLSQGKSILAVLSGSKRIDQLTNADIMRFVAKRRAEVSNATVNRQLQMLGRALRHMAKFHGARVPDLDLKAAETKEAKERVRELAADEQDRLFEKLRADLHPLVSFALMTGARVATITGLRWSDVLWDASRIRFRLKGDEEMLFPINAELRAFLTALPRSDIVSERPYVITFVDQVSAQRRRITPNGGSVHADFRAALVAAEIEDFRFHDLRHTFATRMLRRTGNLKLVSRLLGHKSIETTMRYAHVLDTDLHDAMTDFRALATAESRKNPRRAEKT